MEILSSSYPIAKKAHRCNWCHQPIQIGEKYEYFAIKGDDFYTWKNHISCMAIARKLDMFDDDCGEGVTDETFQNYIEEAFSDLSFAEKLEIVKNKYL